MRLRTDDDDPANTPLTNALVEAAHNRMRDVKSGPPQAVIMLDYVDAIGDLCRTFEVANAALLASSGESKVGALIQRANVESDTNARVRLVPEDLLLALAGNVDMRDYKEAATCLLARVHRLREWLVTDTEAQDRKDERDEWLPCK